MKKRKHVCLGGLALVLVLIFLASCSGDKPKQPTERTAAETEPETENPYDENGYLKDNLPTDLNYRKTINLLCWKTAMVDEFGTEEQNEKTNSISQAFYARNCTTEARLGVNLKMEQIDGDNKNMRAFCAHAMNGIMGGSNYDLIGCYSMAGGTLSVQNALLDLLPLRYVEMDYPWWSQKMQEISRIDGKQYVLTGDISGEILYNMMFLVYNTEIGENQGLSDPREYVFDGTWTVDKMLEIASGVYTDLNNSKVKDVGDRFGLIVSTQVLIDGFFYGCGYTVTEKTEQGKIRLTADYNGVHAYDLFSKLNRFLQSDYGIYDNGNTAFKQGKALIGTAQAANFSTIKENGWRYSILPFPKSSEAQKDYYSALGFGHSFYGIPVSAADPEMSGAVLECLASESYRTTTPEIFQRVFRHYTFDEPDWRIFNLIKAGIISDHARIFSERFSWSKSVLGMMRSCVINNTAGSFLAKVQENENYINGVFDEIMKKEQ
mgnify:FL=1